MDISACHFSHVSFNVSHVLRGSTFYRHTIHEVRQHAIMWEYTVVRQRANETMLYIQFRELEYRIIPLRVT